MLKPLPIWTLNEKHPAFFDSESLTAIEQTARVYGKMQELVDSYNQFAEEINTTINDWNSEINSNYDEFTKRIEKITSNYINCLDMKINLQNKDLSDAISFMKNNIVTSVENYIKDEIAAGNITISMQYENENLDLIVSQEGV